MSNNHPIEKIAPKKISVWERNVIKIKSGRDRKIEKRGGKRVSRGSFYVNVPAPVAKAFEIKKGSKIYYKQVLDSISGNILFIISFE